MLTSPTSTGFLLVFLWEKNDHISIFSLLFVLKEITLPVFTAQLCRLIILREVILFRNR